MRSCGAASVAANFAPLVLGSAIGRTASQRRSAASRATSQRSRGVRPPVSCLAPICPVEMGVCGRRALGRWSSIRVGAQCLQAIESWSRSPRRLFVNADTGANTEIESASGLRHQQQHDDAADTSRHAAGHRCADDRFKRQPTARHPARVAEARSLRHFVRLNGGPGRAA